MHKQAGAIIALVISFFATTALGAEQGLNLCTRLTSGIDDSDLVSARSFTTARDHSEYSAYNLLSVVVDHDDSAAGTVTQLDMTCVSVVPDLDNLPATKEAILQSCSVSAGVCTSTDNDFQKTVSGTEDKIWSWRVDVGGAQEIKCTVSAGAGTGHADDALNVDLPVLRELRG